MARAMVDGRPMDAGSGLRRDVLRGAGGYHQMDVMGEALEIGRKDMVSLGEQEAEPSARNAGDIIDRICAVASNFTAKAKSMFPGKIT